MKTQQLVSYSLKQERLLSEDHIFQKLFRKIIRKTERIINQSKLNSKRKNQMLDATIFQHIANRPKHGYVEILQNLQISGIDITHPKVVDAICCARLFTFKQRRTWIKTCIKSNPLFRDLFFEKARQSIRAILKIEKKILKKIQKYSPKYGTITRKLQKMQIGVTECEVVQIVRKNYFEGSFFPGKPTTAS